MTDLLRLATELERSGGMHRLTALIQYAVRVMLEHEHGVTVRGERWPLPLTESNARPCTCHPSEAPVPCQRRYAQTECEKAAREAASRAPERAGLHGGSPGYPTTRGVSVGTATALGAILTEGDKIRAQSGITHADDSPLMPRRMVPKFAAPIEETGE